MLAAANQSFWKEALETATSLYYIGPPSPTAMFFGFKPDVSMLRTWECLAHVHIPAIHTSVFSPKPQVGILSGYSSSSKAYTTYVGLNFCRHYCDD